MFVGISNTPRPYAWGSKTAIAEQLGWVPYGGPEAELWLGAHPGSPSRIVDPPSVSGAPTLDQIVALPFLLKLLAAAAPLSLQAHPSISQALAGFARENQQGISVDAPHRNYRDTGHKPELLYALSNQFRALCGFAPASATRERIGKMIEAHPAPTGLRSLQDRLISDSFIGPTFEWLISRGEGVDRLIDDVVDAATAVSGVEFDLVGELALAHPGDPGIVISLMLNFVSLRQGEALFLPAGNIHAYIEGFGIEVMSSSDNVLRGGLTAKHIDVPELLSILNFAPLPVPYLFPQTEGIGVVAFRPPTQDFALLLVEHAGVVALTGPAVLLCVDGNFAVTGAMGSMQIARGASSYVSADEAQLRVAGNGRLFIATTG